MKNILLAEDDPCDVELTLIALDKNKLASKIFVVNDGAEALDYLYCRGKFQARVGGASHCGAARQQDAESERSRSIEDHES